MSDDENLITLYPEYDPDPDVVYPYTPGLDNSSVRCICAIPFDDGATIQCDGCWVWQHMVCMEIDRSCIPKVYYCEECKERTVNVQKAVLNQEKMQKQRRVERVSVIKEILIKKGILDKPSPRKKKESRGRKVLPSPKKSVKPLKQKIVEQQSPLANSHTTVGNGRILVPEFPFRDILCLDDWTDGFLGRGPEKIKKSNIENVFDAEYADWAVNCAKVQGNQFNGLEKKVREFVEKMEKIAQIWDGRTFSLISESEHHESSVEEKDILTDNDIFPKIEKSENMEASDVSIKMEAISDDKVLDIKNEEVESGNTDIENLETNKIQKPDYSKSLDMDEGENVSLDDCAHEMIPHERKDFSDLVQVDESLKTEFQAEEAPQIDTGVNPVSKQLNTSALVEENQIECGKFSSCVLVTNREVLKTAPVRYSVDLIPIKRDSEIPYYGLFSTSTITPNSYICSTFGTLSDISDLSTSLLPCKVAKDIYTLPPFTFKVLQNENWILDCRTRGDLSGRYVRRSCSATSANASMYCIIVQDELVLSEKLIFGIFSTKEISVGEEIVLSIPGCQAYPCACEIEQKCNAREHFENISQEYASGGMPSSLDIKEVQLNKKFRKNGIIKKKLPVFLRVLVLSHQKKMKSLEAEKLRDPPVAMSIPTKNPSFHIPKEPALSHSRTASGSAPKRKPPHSPAIESPKALSREERKLREQLALFEKMEQQDKKKRKRRSHDDPSIETASPISKKESEEEENYTAGSSSKIDNETSESIGRDSPASVTDMAEKHDDDEAKRKIEDLSVCEPMVFKKPKLESLEKDSHSTPAPLVRKLSLKDFLQKRNQNKTPSPSSSNQFFPSENPTT